MPTVTVIQPTITEEKSTVIRCVADCRVSFDSEDQMNSFMVQTRYYSRIFENSETEELIDIYANEEITGTCEDKREEFQLNKMFLAYYKMLTSTVKVKSLWMFSFCRVK